MYLENIGNFNYFIMKNILTAFFLLIIGNELSAQSVGIGTNTPNPKAALEVNSTSKGVLIPSMTSSQRIAISTPPNGLMVYDTDKNEFYHYNGTGWRAILNGDYWSRPITSRDRITNFTDSIGIGTNSPTARLHVNGDVKITDGTQGDGKVLTSDANGLASWQNAAYTTNDRILVKFNGISDSLMGTPMVIYDNGPGISFNLVTNDFTIFKSGLYHFEGTVTGNPNISSSVPFILKAGAFIDGLYYHLASLNQLISNNNGLEFYTLKYSIDIYLAFGTRIGFRYFCNGYLPHLSSSGFASGYLISQ